jgi:HAD superfamily hydrolase (TIGR01509 family)
MPSTYPSKKRAVIFDMDGVITDSEPFYAEAINIVLAGHGHVLTTEDHRAIMGSSIDYTWEFVVSRFKLGGDVAQWKRLYDTAVVDILKVKPEPAPGLYWLLDELEKRKVPIALATSSQLNWAQTITRKLKVEHRFRFIATADMVPHAKPAPDLYLFAAGKLGLPPADCLAIEDSPRGISSAKAAKMTAIAIRTPHTVGMDISKADRIISSLREFDFTLLA